LLRWDLACRKASSDVVGSLLELLERKKRFSGDAAADLRGLLAQLAVAAAGKSNVDNDRCAAINEALAPILYDRLMHQSTSADERGVWNKAFSAADAKKLTLKSAASLNTLSHVAAGKMVSGDRGVVFTLRKDAGQFFADRAGVDLKSLELQFVQTKDGPAKPNLLEDMAKCRWVLVGVRAVCDQAQARGDLRPVALGLEVPGDLKAKEGDFRVRSHGACMTTPAFEDPANPASGPRQILLNWHWIATFGPKELKGAKPLYRLREALINQITAAQSGYSARPGIVSFAGG
jgi:hypothetical protein